MEGPSVAAGTLEAHVDVPQGVIGPAAVEAQGGTGPDGRCTAPDMRPVCAQAKTAGMIADAVMRERLSRELGVEWTSARNGVVELAGVPEAVREHFSARAEILEEAG